MSLYTPGIITMASPIQATSFLAKNKRDLSISQSRDSILSARLTETYYWPLTNEIKASWDKQNEPVQGSTRRILQNGQTHRQSLNRTNYTIQYDANDMFGTIELYMSAKKP